MMIEFKRAVEVDVSKVDDYGSDSIIALLGVGVVVSKLDANIYVRNTFCALHLDAQC